MPVEGADNAACVREEIVCVPSYFYQSPPLDLNITLTRAQAALSAVDRGGQSVLPLESWRPEGSSSAITHGRLLWVWP